MKEDHSLSVQKQKSIYAAETTSGWVSIWELLDVIHSLDVVSSATKTMDMLLSPTCADFRPCRYMPKPFEMVTLDKGTQAFL